MSHCNPILKHAVLVSGLSLLLLAPPATLAQQGMPDAAPFPLPSADSGPHPAPAPPGFSDARLREQMAKAQNSERQKQLVADTQKLYELARELRDEVAQSNKDELSISVIKTSGKIEKLAKSVKDKMRGY